MKKLMLLILLLTWLSSFSSLTGQSYVLDFKNPDTYSVTCGSVNPAQWRVVDEECFLYTPYLRVDVDSLGQHYLEYCFRFNRSGNMESTDTLEFQFLKNTNEWISFRVIKGDDASNVDTLMGKLFTGSAAFSQVRIRAKNDDNTEFWAIKDGELIIGNGEIIFPPQANDDVDSTLANVPIFVRILDNDTDPDGDLDSTSFRILITDAPKHGTACEILTEACLHCPMYTIHYRPDYAFSGVDTFRYVVSDSTGLSDEATVFLTINAGTKELLLWARVMLQGPVDDQTGAMNDDLRELGMLPLMEPYSRFRFCPILTGGGERIRDTVLLDQGLQSIVDWVWIELRDKSDPTVVVATRSGLVQSDGDVVDLDGISPLSFGEMDPDSFFVAIRHRNHLGIMTADPVWLSGVPTAPQVDFSNPNTLLWGSNGSVSVGSMACLIAGDTDGDGKVIYAGPGNDGSWIFTRVFSDPLNSSGLPNFIAAEYHYGDTDMDGSIIYSGPDNDVVIIFNNVLNISSNTTSLPNFIILEQIP